MDGTLYSSTLMRTKFAEAAYHTLAQETSISLDKARQKIERKRRELAVRYGDSVPYTLTLRAFGIPIEVWHEYNTAYFDPRDLLMPDEVLRSSLEAVKKKYTLAVLTNNNETQTERTLEALGIQNLFDNVFTYNSFNLLKPDPSFFMRVVECLKVLPAACCFIGDRYDVDLKPAKKIGMSIREVRGPKDLYDLEQCLQQGERT
jgi:putative hydrolase of the HAD superfamily